MNKRVVIIIVVVLVVLAGGGFLAMKMLGAAKIAMQGKMKGLGGGAVVRLEEVGRGELMEFISAPGAVEPIKQVNISAKVSATITAIPVKEGDKVEMADPDTTPATAPTLLLKLDSKDLESRLRNAKANHNAQKAGIEVSKAILEARRSRLAGTKADFEKTRRDHERQEKLFKTGDISASAYDTSKQTLTALETMYQSELKSIKADELSLVVSKYRLESSQAIVDEAIEALKHTTILAPMCGTIIRINNEVGEVVTGTINNPGTVIMTIGDLSQMLVVAAVDEADIGKLEVGQEAAIRVKAFWEEEFNGVVDTIALTNSQSANRTKYFRTKILIQGDVSKLYSGLTADVDICTEKHLDIIKIPSQAVMGCKVDDVPLEIREDNPNVDMKKNDVMVVYRYIDGKAVVTPVTIGPGDLTHIIIRSGLSEGDKVIVGPYKVLEGLKHDQAVKDERVVLEEKKAREKKAAEKKAGKKKAGKKKSEDDKDKSRENEKKEGQESK